MDKGGWLHAAIFPIFNLTLTLEDRVRLNIGKQFYLERVVKLRHRLLREAVAAPSLKMFQTKLDWAWSNLV